MKLTTRIYLDAALQNVKSVTFFTFLQVLIARLGATNFQISLSNSLPPLFCALSLAFITRQLPVTKKVYRTSGYIRQVCFLCMALSPLTPYPIPLILFFWTLNAVAVMITGAQQPAILRRWVEPSRFPQIFSNNKLIGISIVVVGSYFIGRLLDATDVFFPNNYVISMLVGCVATFTGMSLIAALAPDEKVKIRFKPVVPFKECDRTMWWMALNNIGISMAAPLFTIYHIKILHLTNTQIGYFVIASGLVSFAVLPLARKWMERYGAIKIYTVAVLGMAFVVLPYGWVGHFGVLVVMQAWIGVCTSIYEVSSQSVMMDEVQKHNKEMDYISDFQLLMNGGNAIGALIAGALVAAFPMWTCFLIIAATRLIFLLSAKIGRRLPAEHTKALNPVTRNS